MSTCAIAVDIGGTKIATAFIDPTAPTHIHGHAVRPTRAMEGREVVLDEVIAAVAEACTRAEAAGYHPDSVGIGAPGVVDTRTGSITYAGPTMPGWAETQLASAVSEETGLKVAVHNDVRVMGLGEAVYGAGRAIAGDILFVSIGTGIGGALVSNGELSISDQGTRGEIAYLRAPTLNGRCDTIENIGSGPALARTYNGDVDLYEIMRRYHAGEQRAHDVVTRSLECVGVGLAGFINAVDVTGVVVGGGVGSLGEPIIAPLRNGLRANLLSPLQQIPILPAELGTNAPLVGAAHLARQS